MKEIVEEFIEGFFKEDYWAYLMWFIIWGVLIYLGLFVF